MIATIGFDCGRFNLDEIVNLYLDTITDRWNHTATITAAIENVLASDRQPADNFHPLKQSKLTRGQTFTPDDIDPLRKIIEQNKE